MDKITYEITKTHKQLITQINKSYEEISKNISLSFLTGKKEAYEEILNWLYTQNENKYILPSSFINMLNEKNIKTKIGINSKTDNDDYNSYFPFELKRKSHYSPQTPIPSLSFPLSVSSLFTSTVNNNFEYQTHDDALNPLKKRK